MSRLECCEFYHSCHPGSVASLLKRTLSFQKSIDGKIDVKLVGTDCQIGRYIALSHLWGSAQHCTLTFKNLLEYQSSISWNILPKTFQDAIIFCTMLEVHYIWIEALCIIQDDPTDWEIESAKVADVYQQSYLTLAATGSSDDRGGCFPAIDLAVSKSTEYELTTPFKSPRIIARKKVEHWTRPLSKASAYTHPVAGCFRSECYRRESYILAEKN